MGSRQSYGRIIKSTGIFGGVQVITALAGIVKTKLVALILGAEGVGMYGLLQNTISMISNLSNVGLSNSAVREIAQFDPTVDHFEISRTITIIKRWALMTGLSGLLITLLMSSTLSQLIFENKSYAISFIWLSFSVLFDQLSSSNIVILQGLRKLNYLAKANIIGSLTGLIISVPCFYYYGEKGIIPALILSSFSLLARSYYYSRKLAYDPVPVSWRDLWKLGGNMMKLGVILSFSGFIGMGSMYFLRVWIGREIGLEYVGYYNSAFMIIEGYVAMVFSAMSTDFFPRLSKVQENNTLSQKLINEQAEISIIVLTPVLLVLIGFSEVIISLLYSESFTLAAPVLRFATIGVLFKAFSFPFGYIYVAKAHKKVFLIKEIFSWMYILVSSITMYYLYDIEGLGIGYAIGYCLSTIQNLLLNRYLYHIHPAVNTSILFLISLAMLSVMNYIQSIENYLLEQVLTFFLITFSFIYSYTELNKRIHVRQFLSNLRKR
ncbi:MAG: oligosaccharide flippase family protein [Bacteroidales bacterium]